MAAMEVEPTSTADSKDIDEGLYSRQLYVFGHEAQQRMAKSNVLLVGLKGLGVEIAKNIILAGVHSVGLLDLEPVEMRDLSSQFYLSESDVGRPRAEASFPMLQTLNKYVDTHVVREPFSTQLLGGGRYQVVVVTGKTVMEQVEIDEFCRAHNIKFIAADINGLASYCFVDVGTGHVVSDTDGERPFRGLIVNITQGDPGIVTVHDDKRHGLQSGDFVTFEEVEGMTELNDSTPRPIKVLDSFSFAIENTLKYKPYSGQGYFQQVKLPVTVNHDSLRSVLSNVQAKMLHDVYGHSNQLHFFYQGLFEFRRVHHRYPSPLSVEDAQAVVALAKQAAASSTEFKVDVDEKMAYKLARCSSASLNPMAAFLGGVVGQEVLKASSGKFTPLNQLMYFDSVECLPDVDVEMKQYAPLGSRYDDQIAVFGRAMQQRISGLNLFLVGAGAIGCEMLKNWSLMGVATDGKGVVHVTDMDQIEKSNLNRQFLFRPDDVGKLKSQAAAAAVRVMNPAIRVNAQALRVGVESEEVFDDRFWESLDATCTALDNVDARLYVDQRCVYFQKPMIDSGTLGTKGNTQVVVPFLTESYGSSRDPPEESIPICTLKNFPNKIEHTIQWARDHFEGLFKQGPDEVNNYLSNPEYLNDLEKQPNQQVDSLRTVESYLETDRPLTFDACVAWGRLLFEKEFNHNIQQLLHVFPPDSLTSSGVKFWSGTKRAPVPIPFHINDPLHLEYVMAAANLRAFNYGLKGEADPDYFRRVIPAIAVPPFVPKQVKIAADEAEAKKLAEDAAAAEDQDVQIKQICDRLPSPSKYAGYRLHPSEFEKDDDTNFHMDYVTACSNLRARNYRIKEESKHQTKFIAGKIMPAIATTTALVTGLVCLELYKVLQKKPLEAFRNTFVNLALPLITMSEPFAPASKKASLADRGAWQWSLWDRIEVDNGDMTLGDLLDYFKTKFGLEITMLSYGASMLYYDFGGPKKKLGDRLKLPLSKVAETVSKQPIPVKDKYLVLEACVNDLEGNEVDIPYVRFKFR